MVRKGLYGTDMSRYLNVTKEQRMKIWEKSIRAEGTSNIKILKWEQN